MLLSVGMCYVCGIVFILLIQAVESNVLDRASPEMGFAVHHIGVVFLYSYISWQISRFFRQVQGQPTLR